MKKFAAVIVLIVLAGGGAYAYWRWTQTRPAADKWLVSGNIEVTDARLSFKIAGRMVERPVDEGQDVAAGALVARLDPTDQEQAAAKAQAKLAQSEAALLALEHGSRAQEIAAAEADVDRARAGIQSAASQAHQAQLDHGRFQALQKRGVVSVREYDQTHTQLQAAQAAVREAQAREAAAREALSLKKEGPRPEDIDQAKALVAVDREALVQARQMVEYTRLNAPFAGVVLSKSAEVGEYLNPGSTVVTLGSLDKVWLRAYVNQTQLDRIHVGQEVRVTTDAHPGVVFNGRLTFIGREAEFTPKTVQTFEERVKLMFRIKVELDNPGRRLKPGMPADAAFIQNPR